jgi:hypothetical protein
MYAAILCCVKWNERITYDELEGTGNEAAVAYFQVGLLSRHLLRMIEEYERK